MSFRRRSAVVLILPLLALLSSAIASAWPVAAQEDSRTFLDYELAEVWTEKLSSPQAGQFDFVLDMTSSGDGSRFVLERSRSVHRLAPDGVTWDWLVLPRYVRVGAHGDRQWVVQRIDSGPDGEVAVMGRVVRPRGDPIADEIYVVFSLAEQDTWQLSHVTALDPLWSYRDFAMGPQGRAYLARWTMKSTNPPGSIDVLAPLAEDPAGSVTQITVPELGHPSRVDVQADGTIYALSRSCESDPLPTRKPSPTRTPRPSDLSAGHGLVDQRLAGHETEEAVRDTAPLVSVHGQTMAMAKKGVQGLVVIGPDRRTRETWRGWQFGDVSVSAGEAFIIEGDMVMDIALRQQVADLGAIYAAGVELVAIDVAADQRLTVANDSHGFLGLFEVDPVSGKVFRILGTTGAPELSGPRWPRRLAVDEDRQEVLVLDGHVLERNAGGYAKAGPIYGGFAPGALQRWTANGRLRSQNGMLSINGLDGELSIDVTALDGRAISITSRDVIMRPDRSLPSFLRHFSGREASFAAVDAHGDRVAILDIGREFVLVLNSDGELQRDWSTWTASPNALPADVAIFEDRVYLADRGRNHIMVRDTHGRDLGEWPTNDGPLRVAVGPHGDVFVLGRGGWLLRYTPDGSLVSWRRVPPRGIRGAWRMVTPGDLDIDAQGRVHVSWWVEGDDDTIEEGQSGISIFEPVWRSAEEGERPLEPGACLVTRTKRASPSYVTIGSEVLVSLTLKGECPGTHRKSQVVIVFDRSASIEWNGALLRAKEAMVGLLDTLNGEQVEIGLVSFADGGALDVPLTDRLGDVRGRIATLAAEGDTQMSAGIDLARRELLGPRRDPAAEQHIWIVSDGIFKDQPTEAVERARDDGIIVDALIYRTREYSEDARDSLRSLFGEAHLHEELDSERDLGVVQQISAFVPQRQLFDALTVEDVIPSNMRLVESSVQPPATRLDASTLQWSFTDVLAAEPPTMTYRLEPLELGRHPTNVEANAVWVDAWGHDGQRSFPVPQVKVIAPPDPGIERDRVAYLPFASRERCHRRQPLDIVFTVDTSGSMSDLVAGREATALDVARDAMRDLVRRLDLPGDRVAVVEFNATARMLTAPTGSRATILGAIEALRPAPGSRLDLGLAVAAHAIDGAKAPRGQPIIILLTDGRQYESRNLAISWSDAMRSRGVVVYAVGFGPTVDEELLRRLASTPDGYYRSVGAQDLRPVYGRIGAELACPGG